MWRSEDWLIRGERRTSNQETTTFKLTQIKKLPNSLVPLRKAPARTTNRKVAELPFYEDHKNQQTSLTRLLLTSQRGSQQLREDFRETTTGGISGEKREAAAVFWGPNNMPAEGVVQQSGWHARASAKHTTDGAV